MWGSLREVDGVGGRGANGGSGSLLGKGAQEEQQDGVNVKDRKRRTAEEYQYDCRPNGSQPMVETSEND